jgi:hypothetical protein
MLDLIKIVLGAFAGTSVFVLGQAVLKLVIEPIQEHRRTIGRIIDDLIYYAPVWYLDRSTANLVAEALQTLRRRSSELHAATELIPCYRWWEKLRLVRPETAVAEISDHLRGLISATSIDSRDSHLRAIQYALGTRITRE